MNAFGEILDSFEKHCSTSNIQVRNGGVQEFKKNSATNTSIVDNAESVFSKKGIASQVTESKFSGNQNNDLKSDLIREKVKPNTI